ncbi:MAG: transglutaminase domain-containing protein [Chloroflexi bacterium]|nr:transglutaminase domain-containing protein [Chloroflexota bacterium]
MAARVSGWLNGALLSGQGWLSLLLLWLSLVLFSVTLPWQNAQWELSLPPFFWISISGLLVGLFLSQIEGRALWRHSLGALAGAGISIGVVAATLTEGGWQERVGQLAARTRLWFVAAQEGWSNNDLIVLVLLLAAVSWLLGYLGPWCVLVWRKAFVLVLAGGVLILEGLYYVPQPASVFVIYLWSSLMLVMHLSLTPRDNPSGLRPAHHLGLLAMAGLLVLVIWLVPLPQGLLKGGDLWERVPPWREIVNRSEELFPVLATSRGQEQTPNSDTLTYGNALTFGGPIQRTGDILFEVEGPPLTAGPGRWRAIAYDLYTSQGWRNEEQVLAPATSLETGQKTGFQSRQEVTQTIKLLVRSDLLFAAGQPLEASLPAKQERPAPLTYTIPLPGEPQKEQGLPEDVKAAAGQLRLAASSGELSVSRISRYLPSGFKTVGLELEGSNIAAVKIQRESAPVDDISALRIPYILRPPTGYTVTSSVSLATSSELMASKAPLPDWVQERYLTLPPTLPARVRQLAASVTWTWGDLGAKTAYEKALAIQEYLRRLTYRQDIKAPPLGADGVDYFLFISKTGYSQYFASAMVVMLRSLGVPARLAVGFVSDEYDLEKNVYEVRDSHAHAWVEVFFPEYGWVEFEPTPGWLLPAVSSPPLAGGELVNAGWGFGFGPGAVFGEEPEFDEDGLPRIIRPIDGTFPYPTAPGSSPATPGPTGPAAAGPGGAAQTPSPAPGVAIPGSSPARPVAPSTATTLLPTALIGMALSLLLAVLLYLWWRSWSARGDEGELYTKLCRLATWGRLRPQPWLTPLEYGNRLSAALPSQGNAIHLIVDTYGRWLYGKRGGSEEARQQLRGAWLSLRGELLKRIFRPW